jgi:hypothetical protein
MLSLKGFNIFNKLVFKRENLIVKFSFITAKLINIYSRSAGLEVILFILLILAYTSFISLKSLVSGLTNRLKHLTSKNAVFS